MRTMVVRALLLLAALAAPALAQPLPDTVLQALQQAQVPADALRGLVAGTGRWMG